MNPFVEAAMEVLQAECSLAVGRGSLALQRTSLTTDEVTVLLSLIGQVQGVVLYSMSEQTGLGLVSRVMGQEFSAFGSLAQSGVSELGNVITGQASVKMSQAGWSVNISPPTLIRGKGVTLSTLDFTRVVVPLQTEAGQITVHLAVRESPPGMSHSNFVPVSVPVQSSTENKESA
jgi:chemotaxis protein CheX